MALPHNLFFDLRLPVRPLPFLAPCHPSISRNTATSVAASCAKQTPFQTVDVGVPPVVAPASPFFEVHGERPWDFQSGARTSLGICDTAATDHSSETWREDVLRVVGAVTTLSWSAAVAPLDCVSDSVGSGFSMLPNRASKECNSLGLTVATRENDEGRQAAPANSASSPSQGAVVAEGDEQPPPEEAAMEDRLPEMRELLALLEERRKKDAEEKARENDSDADSERGCGSVWLVGTGPGDPELLTVKAVRILQSADLILYDRLVTMDVLRLASPSALLLYVGKAAGFHSRTQQEILALLLAFARAGAIVVRLKGGDPLVFGRGGEEVEFLQAHGVAVHVVPGITAASGIAAGLGIPLTHRGIANSVRFLTGHLRKGGGDPFQAAASAAADRDCTLVVYMGLASLPALAARLVEAGLPPDTPAVLVERGTTPMQRTVFSYLKHLPESAANAKLVSPTLVIVGLAVALSPFWPLPRPDSVSAASSAAALAPGVDSRDRSLRGPDPLLPSQRLSEEHVNIDNAKS